MSWQRMRFRGDRVWVRVDGDGRPVVDADGRAEMKYREADALSYRPAAANLTGGDDGDAPGGGTQGAAAPKRARRPATGATRASASKSHRRAAGDGPWTTGGPDDVQIWTDGACTGNPGPMGIGIVVIDGTRRVEHGEYLGQGTNNIAELVAIERGIEIAEGMDLLTRPLVVHTDSTYAIGLLSRGWKAKANKELVARMRTRLARLARLRFVKVAGHAGIADNETCDRLARDAITNARR